MHLPPTQTVPLRKKSATSGLANSSTKHPDKTAGKAVEWEEF
jgi:hypothetical protein